MLHMIRRTVSSETNNIESTLLVKPPSSGNNEDQDGHYQSKPALKTSIMLASVCRYMNSIRLMVLLVLCLQNSMFTILRRYSQGVLQENYSKHELLLVAELIKIAYAAWMISKNLSSSSDAATVATTEDAGGHPRKTLVSYLLYLIRSSQKMLALALIYGAMNILSFVSLRNISAGMFTIFAQCKILTTATFSTIMLKRKYSWTQWRALIALIMGILLFSQPIWEGGSTNEKGNPVLGTIAVLIEVTLSGFASIYFEKVIKTDPLQLGIWERNFQLAVGSVPVYLIFIVGNGGGTEGFFGGWSLLAAFLAALGAAGGLLVALSIKYGDSILKTLATTGAIVLTGVLDHLLLGGPLTPAMIIAAVQVIIAICNYTFDATVNDSSDTNSTTATTSPSKTKSNASTIPSGEADEDGSLVLLESNSTTETKSLIRR
jgi:UDP-sugar transporter A1/2/3